MGTCLVVKVIDCKPRQGWVAFLFLTLIGVLMIKVLIELDDMWDV